MVENLGVFCEQLCLSVLELLPDSRGQRVGLDLKINRSVSLLVSLLHFKLLSRLFHFSVLVSLFVTIFGSCWCSFLNRNLLLFYPLLLELT